MSRKRVIDKIKSEIRKKYPNSKIILYGSRARGDNSDLSDWDILIIIPKLNNSKDKQDIMDSLFEIELETDQIFSPIVHTKNEWKKLQITPFYKNVTQDGIIL